MAVRTGVMSSGTSGKAIYDLIAADLAANPNWSRPANNPTVTGATDSYGANYTSQIWKCTVGSQVFHLAFSYDTTTNVNDLFVTPFEAWDGSDGGGVPAAKKLRRPAGGGTAVTDLDSTSVTPGTTDLVSNADVSIPSTSPMVAVANVVGSGSAFSYLFKVGNKSVVIGYNVAGANRFIIAGAFESLVTGPSDTMPLGMFTHGKNTPANKGGTPTSVKHGDGVVTRNPGLGTTAESGAFFAFMTPLHTASLALNTAGSPISSVASVLGFGASVPRWYTKVLMSQAVIHQSRDAHSGAVAQGFRGYFPDIFACTMSGSTEPTGGGVDSVVIDGVTFYWLGLHCCGPTNTTATTAISTLVAVRAD